jgi:hypothetical protein
MAGGDEGAGKDGRDDLIADVGRNPQHIHGKHKSSKLCVVVDLAGRVVS